MGHSFILLQRRPNKQTELHNNQTNWKENCHCALPRGKIRELPCCRNAKKPNKQTNNQTIWWENHRCALPKRKTRESPCCRNETWLFALLMSALLSIAEMAKLRNLVQCCSARWRSRGAEKLFIHKVIWKV